MTHISINKDDFSKLSISAQTEILNLFKNNSLIDSSEEMDGELTKKQVNEIIKGLSEKSRNVLKAVANLGSNFIAFDDLLVELEADADEIKGVWSGLTTRSRNITHDPDFTLIEWVWQGEECFMKFHPTTYTHIVSYFQ